MKMIQLCPYTKSKRWILALIELCAIVDALVFLFTWGYIKTNFRVKLLFSEWLSNEE